METYNLEQDIKVFCVTAKSFPDGVLEAHQKLHSLVPFTTDRKYFGISWPEANGVIGYKAAMEELKEGELSHHKLEEFIIKKGKYLMIDIPNFMSNIPAIGEAFQKLIADERIDPNGVCVEWYLKNEVCRCMVRTKEK